MQLLAILTASIMYFALGGLWFTPLFGKQWDKAVGFERPPNWRPRAIYYLGPLLGSLVATGATYYLAQLVRAESFADYFEIGLVVGLGYGANITMINSISPNMPRPGLYTCVVGCYHLIGLLLCATVLYVLS